MSKRAASSSPIEHYHSAKKLKSADAHESAVSQPIAIAPETLLVEPSTEVDMYTTDPLDGEHDQKASTGKTARNKGLKRSPVDGFRPWVPKAAHVDIPKVQPHWGIVPRPGGYTRPSQQQPSARESDGAIRPALWQDRKGAVRLKRGDRFIKDYDQAFHMWLPLMDLRPDEKTREPRRKAFGYYYKHGIPIDWTDTVAINNLNKALQAAISSSSNEQPWNQYERETLAQIFAENPNISLLDAAEQFNELAHPPTKGDYPSGRFTESIQHEFQIYKSSYIKGEAPTNETEKEIPLEKLYKEWKDEQAKAKAIVKKKTKQNRKKTVSSKMSNKGGVTKKKGGSKKKEFSAEELAGMESRADATFKKIEEEEAAEEAARIAAEDKTLESAKSPLPKAHPPYLSGKDEEIREVAGAFASGEGRSSSPVSASTSAVASISHGETDVKRIDEPKQAAQAVKAQNAATAVENVAQPEVIALGVEATSTFVEKAARVVHIDESYDDETED